MLEMLEFLAILASRKARNRKDIGTVDRIPKLNVAPPQVRERYRRVGRLASAIIATGLLQRQDALIHLIVDRLEDVTARLPDLVSISSDFR